MGNPLLRLVLVLVVLLGGGFILYKQWNAKTAEFDHRADLDRIRKEFLERSSWVRVVPDASKYREEMRGLLRWYFQELTDHYNKFPAFKNYDRAMTDLRDQLARRRVKEGEFKTKEEFFTYAKAGFDMMKEGRYDPLLTAGDKSLRLDIVDIKREGAKLKMDLVLWGAQRRWTEVSEAGVRIRKMQVQATFQELAFRTPEHTDAAKEKAPAMPKKKGKEPEAKAPDRFEMSASGDPEIKVDHPERWVEEFPPQAVLGYYTFDPFPAEADKMQMSVAVLSRSPQGEEIFGRFQWDLQLKDSMKLRPGEAWEGATVETR